MNKENPRRSPATQESAPFDGQNQAGLSSLGGGSSPPSSRFAVLCIEIILVLSGLVGAAFNCLGSVWGFIIWLPGNIGLMILNWKRDLKWQSVLFAAYTLTAAWGIVVHLLRVHHA
jgi:hypothetical protein